MDKPRFQMTLRAARNGNGSAREKLLNSYYPVMYRRANRCLGIRIRQRIDVGDVVQDSLLEAHRDLASFRGENEREFVAWLLRLVANNAAQSVQRHLFTKKRSLTREVALSGPLFARGETPVNKLLRAEQYESLEQLLSQLPADQGRAIALRYLEEYSLAELADYFNRSESAVAGLLKRGLARLRILAANTAENRSGSGPRHTSAANN